MAGNKPMNLKGVLLATAGGAVVLLVGAQLLAKPADLPPLAKPLARNTEDGRAEGRRAATAPELLAFVGRPQVRELFTPLVARKDPRARGGSLATAPVLPPITNTPPASNAPTSGSNSPAASTETPTPTPTPTATGLADLQMLGVVQLDNETKVLLKRTSTGESRYLAKGEDAYGFKIEEIQESEVSLSRDGKTEKLAMSTAVAIEGPGSTSVASASGFSGGGDRRDRGSFGRGDRGERREERGSEGGFTTASLFSLPTWTERLKKLEEIKAQLEPDRYERLKKFMTSRAEAEKK